MVHAGDAYKRTLLKEPEVITALRAARACSQKPVTYHTNSMNDYTRADAAPSPTGCPGGNGLRC